MTPTFSAVHGQVVSILNSPFTSAFLSALAGAGFGVWGAQRIAARNGQRSELTAAIRDANAAIVLATLVANQALTMKKQNVSRLHDAYFEAREKAQAVNKLLLAGVNDIEVPPLKADLTSVTPITVPVEALKSFTYGGTLMPGRALALIPMIEHSLVELARATTIRNAQIEIFKTRKSSVAVWQDYYGFTRRDGNTDSMYHDSLYGMLMYVNDVIFFSVELAEEFQKLLGRLVEKLKKISKEIPAVNEVNFSEAKAAGLVPKRDQYEDWLSGFVTR